MAYDVEYLDLKFSLINIFLTKALSNILDISYSVQASNITIQVVLLENTPLGDTIEKGIKSELSSYRVTIDIVSITKDRFNENKGGWQPVYYKWLPNLLLSKAEAI